MKKKIIGKCALCGINTKLTFEHIQPKSCGNDESIFMFSFDDVIKGTEIFREDRRAKGNFISPKGMGFKSICQSCNNNAGSFYVDDYKLFYQQGLESYKKQRSQIINLSCKNIYPLRVLKEILMMFISVNKTISLGKTFKEYLLNKENRELPKGYNIYAYFTEDMYSFAMLSEGQKCLNGKIKTSCYSLVSFKPFGFILTHKSEPSSRYDGICNITSFSKYTYNEQENLVLPLRTINSPDPLSFPFKQ